MTGAPQLATFIRTTLILPFEFGGKHSWYAACSDSSNGGTFTDDDGEDALSVHCNHCFNIIIVVISKGKISLKCRSAIITNLFKCTYFIGDYIGKK